MTLLLSLLFACQGDTESGFSTSGNNTIDTDALTDSTEGGSGDASGSTNSVNPVISDKWAMNAVRSKATRPYRASVNALPLGCHVSVDFRLPALVSKRLGNS